MKERATTTPADVYTMEIVRVKPYSPDEVVFFGEVAPRATKKAARKLASKTTRAATKKARGKK